MPFAANLLKNILLSQSLKAGLGCVTFVLIVALLFGLVNLEHKYLGIADPIIPITKQTVLALDLIFWGIVALLALELVLIYAKTRDSRKFFRKHWLDIVMLVLMPVFVVFKLLKITIKILKQLKVAKTGFKLVQKLKK